VDGWPEYILVSNIYGDEFTLKLPRRTPASTMKQSGSPRKGQPVKKTFYVEET